MHTLCRCSYLSIQHYFHRCFLRFMRWENLKWASIRNHQNLCSNDIHKNLGNHLKNTQSLCKLGLQNKQPQNRICSWFKANWKLDHELLCMNFKWQDSSLTRINNCSYRNSNCLSIHVVCKCSFLQKKRQPRRYCLHLSWSNQHLEFSNNSNQNFWSNLSNKIIQFLLKDSHRRCSSLGF